MPLRAARFALACALACSALLGSVTQAQTLTGKAAATRTPAPATSKPLWGELTLSQQLALQPLVTHWDTLSAAHKSKWLALSRNFPKMTVAEQAVLHSRMSGWSSLSQQERAQARLNFAEVKQLPADERKAKWEAYQSLSDEQKRSLAQRAEPRPRGAALPVKPAPAQKFAPVPQPVDGHLPRIQLAPAGAPTPVLERPAAPRAVPRPRTMPPVSAEAQVPPPEQPPATP